MSIRWYSTASELTGSTPKKRKALRVKITWGYRQIEHGPPRTAISKFCVCGESEAAILAHAVFLCEEMAKASEMVIMGVDFKMGHYRKDEALPVLPPNRRRAAVFGYSPDYEEEGVEALNLRVVVPGISLSTNLAALQTTITGIATYGTEDASIGNVRWDGQDEDELEATYAYVPLGVNLYDMERVRNEHLVNDDVAAGVADGVLSEKDHT